MTSTCIYIYIYIVTSVRVQISVALETHKEHLLTSHHGLIGHTCGSSTRLHISSVLTDEQRETSPRDSILTFSLFPSRQQRVTDQHCRTDSPAPGYDWEHRHLLPSLIKSTLWGLKTELSLSRDPYTLPNIYIYICTVKKLFVKCLKY